MSDEAARIARAARWRDFYDEPGGIGDMLGQQMAELTRVGMEAVQNTDVPLHERVMLSMKELSKFQQALRGVATDGKLAEHAVAHAARVAELPERKRRWL